MARNPVVLIHGYSDKGISLVPWKQVLVAHGYEPGEVRISEYRSLTNEVTIKDIAEGFDRALRTMDGWAKDQVFDAVVHSTGMLVIRAWLSTYGGESRARRLKRLVALAPATHGSPLAHKGRGTIGAIFKGNRIPGPDFMEAGDAILDGLELGSKFTWELTKKDLLGPNPVFTRGPDSPYVFILCGTDAYDGLSALANTAGSDGTVRWAGAALDTQKIEINLARDPGVLHQTDRERFSATDIEGQGVLPMPFYPIAGKNHGTIVSEPSGALADLVLSALKVESYDEFEAWQTSALEVTSAEMTRLENVGELWQQFVVRARDERDDGINDYFIELFTGLDPLVGRLHIENDVHPYRADPSLRCYHVNITQLYKKFQAGLVPDLNIRIIASSGSKLVGYHGLHSEKANAEGGEQKTGSGTWDAMVALPKVFGEAKVTLLRPFTTTFIEIILNRDPIPFDNDKNEVCYVIDV